MERSTGHAMKMPDDVAEMLRLKACGWGLKRIARHLGCPDEATGEGNAREVHVTRGYTHGGIRSGPAFGRRYADPPADAALLKELDPQRNELAELDGELVPKSAAILMSFLADEVDSDVRFELYLHAIGECRLALRTAAAVKLAHAQYQEFHDVTSLKIYSDALAENGEVEAGVSRAKEALELAIQMHTLVNYAAENLVRKAIKMGSAEAVNEALDALADSTDVPRKGDCALEADWADEAEALGADKELISWVRAVAERK